MFCNLFPVPWRCAISAVDLVLSLCNMLSRVSKLYKVLHELFGPEALHKEIMQTEWHWVLQAGGEKFPLLPSYLPWPWEEFERRSVGKPLWRKAELLEE